MHTLRLDNSKFVVDYLFFPSRSWQQLSLVIRHKSCNKYFVKAAGYFIVDEQHLFKELHTSISNDSSPQWREQAVNSMITSQFQKFSSRFATTTRNSVRRRVIRVIMHKFRVTSRAAAYCILDILLMKLKLEGLAGVQRNEKFLVLEEKIYLQLQLYMQDKAHSSVGMRGNIFYAQGCLYS